MAIQLFQHHLSLWEWHTFLIMAVLLCVLESAKLSPPTLFFPKLICLILIICISTEILESTCQFLEKYLLRFWFELHWIYSSVRENWHLNNTEILAQKCDMFFHLFKLNFCQECFFKNFLLHKSFISLVRFINISYFVPL
jgi:hypothetical protein